MKEFGQVVFYLIVGSCAFVWLVKVPIFSYCATEKLGAPIVLEWVSIGPSEIKMRNLKVEGSSQERSAFLLKAKEAICHCSFSNWFTSPIEIEELSLDSVVINLSPLPANPFQTNWDALEEEIVQAQSGTQVIVKRCVLTNITVIQRDAQGEPVYHEIERLEFLGIQDEHGFPTKQLLEQIRSAQ